MPTKSISLMDEAEHALRLVTAKRTTGSNGFGTDLLSLFNHRLIDFVRQRGEHTYVPAKEKEATHRLLGTMWNKDRNKKDIEARGYALAVVAKPLRPKLRRTTLIIDKVIPAKAPAYRPDGPLRGKQGVLSWIVTAVIDDDLDEEAMQQAIKSMNESACNELYTRLRRASLIKHFE